MDEHRKGSGRGGGAGTVQVQGPKNGRMLLHILRGQGQLCFAGVYTPPDLLS